MLGVVIPPPVVTATVWRPCLRGGVSFETSGKASAKHCWHVLKGTQGTNWKQGDERSTSTAYHFLGARFVTEDDLCQRRSEAALQGCYGDPARIGGGGNGGGVGGAFAWRRLSPAAVCWVTPGEPMHTSERLFRASSGINSEKIKEGSQCSYNGN